MKKFFVAKVLTVALLGVLSINVLSASNATADANFDAFTHEKDFALIDGKITSVTQSMSGGWCEISYDVTIDGQSFSDADSMNTEFCHKAEDENITIVYEKNDPRNHAVAKKITVERINEPSILGLTGYSRFALIPMGVIGAVFIAIIVVITRNAIGMHKKMSDIDGDGLANDDKRATPEQRKLIDEGFRNSGIYHHVRKNITQAEAREILSYLNGKNPENHKTTKLSAEEILAKITDILEKTK